MRKPLFLALALVGTQAAALAQNPAVTEGARLVQYERYGTAKTTLQGPAATDARAAYYLGLAQLGLEDTAGAIATFSRFPEDPANMAGLARIQFLKKNTAEGERLANAAAGQAKKKDPEPLRFAADAYNYGGGNPQTAIALYTKALERGDNPDIRLAMADAQRRAGGSNAGAAQTTYEKITERDPKASLAFSRIGAIWYDAKRYDLALEDYNKAKEADPSNPIPYRELADAYFYSGAYKPAKENFDKYCELSDKSTEDRIRRANFEYLTKNYDGAIAAMQELIASGNERPYMHRIIGYSQYEKKDYPAAMASMQTFFQKQDPAKVLPSDYKYYGLALAQARRFDSAEHYFDRAIATDTARVKIGTLREIAEAVKGLPGDSNSYRLTGTYYGKLVTADTVAAKANDYYYWGFYNFYGRNYPVAAAAFQQMERRYADNPSALPQAVYYQGRIAAAQDDEGKAGTAVPFYTRWLAIEDSEKYTKDKKALMQAYQYLALYSYNKSDKAAATDYVGKIETLEPGNAFAKQIRDAMAKK